MEWKFISQKFNEETGRMVHTEASEIPRVGVLVKITQSFYKAERGSMELLSSSFTTQFIEGVMLEESGPNDRRYWKVVRNG